MIFGPLIRIFRPFEVAGRENIPGGAALICANHSTMSDPFILALSFDAGDQVHVLAKKELFKIPVISFLLRKLGMISVQRGAPDIASLKSSLEYLKRGEKVAIFPEGTRVLEDDSVSAKTGAIKLAERTQVPIIPFFIPRKKPPFKKIMLVAGEPYYIEKTESKRTTGEYTSLADALMKKIIELDPTGKNK